MKKTIACIAASVLLLMLSGCGSHNTEVAVQPIETSGEANAVSVSEQGDVQEEIIPLEEEIIEQETEGPLIVIDAGHQMKANLEQEPVSPDSAQTKNKVAGGTRGVSTQRPEYEVTLEISLLLEEELQSRGYDVVQIRRENDVNISNVERAEMANDLRAEAFLRIHCNGSTNQNAEGAMTICQTSDNPNNGDLYTRSKLLSETILDELVQATGCQREYVWETDSMSGINWCRVPVTLIEVGYMTNPKEDEQLCSQEYQKNIVQGIANGLDRYFQENLSD